MRLRPDQNDRNGKSRRTEFQRNSGPGLTGANDNDSVGHGRPTNRQATPGAFL
jgi:hypothetical protein